VISYYKISSPEPVTKFIADKINTKLAENKKVLWLLSGGSFVSIEVKIAELLEKAQLANLTISLADERYGLTGHKNSNWQQLQAAGFSLPGAQLMPVLKDLGFKETVAAYEKELLEDLEEADYSLASAGIGADGHTFGIKAGSPAIGSNEYVVGYKWDDYERITPTAKLIEKINEIIVYTIGAEKKAVLDMLEQDLAENEQPAQLLKRLDNVTIFNDNRGEVL
jgi:6-phosphogluconolactonase/glucosamine-6-phosphate isomerase/deaminase